jgi:hypothetical protein
MQNKIYLFTKLTKKAKMRVYSILVHLKLNIQTISDSGKKRKYTQSTVPDTQSI